MMTKVGRNDPCPCGSGKKYKQCCMSEAAGSSADSRPSVLAILQEAVAQHQSGCLDRAEALYSRVLAAHPRHPDALHLLGMAAQQRGHRARAVELITEAIGVNPHSPAYYNNLGNVLGELGQFDTAVSNYRKAIALQPTNVGAYYNLGGALRDQGKIDEAISSFRSALAIHPQYFEALFDLGDSLLRQGYPHEAAGIFRRATAIRPDSDQTFVKLGQACLECGDVAEAVVSFQRALAINPASVTADSACLMAKQYAPTYSREAALADHKDFASRFEAPLRDKWLAHNTSRDPERKLKLGFVSGDFHDHPVGFFLEDVLGNLDQLTCDVALYDTSAVCDALTARLQGMGFTWVSLEGLSDDAAADRIRADAIDILVDLSGHTAHNRLLVFARKPAPVQVAWLGYFCTTGLQAMDYILGDPYCIPADESEYFVEKPWLLPQTRLCFTPPREGVAVGPLPVLERGALTFGCFNNPSKITDEVVGLWARVLHAVPDSVLFLKAKPFKELSMCEATISRFVAHGVARERLRLETVSPRCEYLDAYNQVDIALDPFPFTGGTTTMDGLWMGVPVITRRGDRLVAHQGESFLHNIGLPDWIAADDETYVAQAVARASDLPALAKLRSELRCRLRSSPLCDAPRFARNLEAAFRGMWQAYCQKESEERSGVQ